MRRNFASRLVHTELDYLQTIEVKSRCQDLQELIIEQKLSDMHVQVGSGQVSLQQLSQFKDRYGLLEDEKCGGNVTLRLEMDRAASLPESVLVLDGYMITLNGTEAYGFTGTYDADLIVEVPDYDVIFVQTFQFTLRRGQASTEEEIDAEVNSSPYFQGYEEASRHELPSVEVEVGEEAFYGLPAAMDRNADDKDYDDLIEIKVEPGSPMLKRCAPSCLEHDPAG